MSYVPMGPDGRTALIEQLARHQKWWQTSMFIFKNSKGLQALFSVRELRAQLMNFARDPDVGVHQLPPPPKQPDISKLSKEEAEIEINNYMIQLDMYDMAKRALEQHVPVEDMTAINNFFEPYEDSMAATSAVKGKRFHALTKNPEEEAGGIMGMFKRKNNAPS